MFTKRTHKLFAKEKISVLTGIDEIYLVKCNTIDQKVEKSIVSTLEDTGLKVKKLWYKEDRVGEMGIPIALKKYFQEIHKPFYAVAIRGKNGIPKLIYIASTGSINYQ